MNALLEGEGLVVEFGVRRGLADRARKAPQRFLRALDGVDVTLQAGEILALVGESGCGKTTTARALLRLQPLTGGTVRFAGTDTADLRGKDLLAFRRQAQMIFQDPYESLDARFRVRRIVEEALLIHRIGAGPADRLSRVEEVLERVGLTPATQFLQRHPHQLSGGQRQRVAIASALVLEPKLLVADEPVSMLDVSVRAGILRLLEELRSSMGMSILMITHDLSTVGHFADRVSVLYAGRVVEQGPSKAVLRTPLHPYAQALVNVAPRRRPSDIADRVLLSGETPDLAMLPSGCRFSPRCPVAVEACGSEDPALAQHVPGHACACLLVEPFRPGPPAGPIGGDLAAGPGS